MSSSSEEEDLSFEESGNESEGSIFSDAFDSEQGESDESDDPAQLLPGRQWNEILPTVPEVCPPRFQFNLVPKVNISFQASSGVLQYYEHFINNEIVDIIVKETNRYAEQLGNVAGKRKLKGRREWKLISPQEMHLFFALSILQGINKKPEESMYWTKKTSLETPFFRKIMSYNRYCEIKKYLHFVNNDSHDPDNHPNPKLFKIWPIYEHLNKLYQATITPERDITIDETLMLYKGRLSWRQYIPLKKAKFGIKTFMLCESCTGYIWSFIIYTGKTTLFHPKFRSLSVPSQVVMTLMMPLLKQGYCITIDNYYTSPELCDILLTYQTDVIGTVRQNRKDLPAALKNKKLKSGEVTSFRRGKILALKWKDKKDVTMLSSFHDSETVEVMTKSRKLKIKPKVIVAYNKTMGGVDLVDQYLSTYHVARNGGKKYYKKIFFHLLDQAVFNAFQVYKKDGGNKSHLKFRLDLIDQIIDKYHSFIPLSRPGRPSNEPESSRLYERHFLELIPPTEKKENPARQCKVCSSKKNENGKKIRRETRYYCKDCNVGLCIPCFKLYHTQKNY